MNQSLRPMPLRMEARGTARAPRRATATNDDDVESAAIRVRPAASQDAARIAAIWNHEALATLATTDTEARGVVAQRRWLAAHSTAYPVIVAADGVRRAWIAGFAALTAYRPKPAFRNTVEDSVYVDRAWRRSGVGRLLLRELLRLAETNGHHSVVARITTGNVASRRLHESFGFRLVASSRRSRSSWAAGSTWRCTSVCSEPTVLVVGGSSLARSAPRRSSPMDHDTHTPATVTPDIDSRVRSIRARLPGQMLRERIQMAELLHGPLYSLAEVRQKVGQALPRRAGYVRGAALEPIEEYRQAIPDEALLKYDDAVRSNLFARFWVATPTYYQERQVDPWILGEVTGTDRYAVIARWD